MDRKTVVKKGEKTAKDLAEHVERLAANVITGDTAEHLSNAGKEILSTVNKTMEDMSIPEDTRKHLLNAEKETLLAMKSVLDAVIKEIDGMNSGVKKPAAKLKRIKIK